ncbi:MAG: hypothetical protein KDA89_23135, partial [Planctomycetaceae bacterium]|nr:hypothetical protein [Planctomycetaceae bacterium]
MPERETSVSLFALLVGQILDAGFPALHDHEIVVTGKVYLTETTPSSRFSESTCIHLLCPVSRRFSS